MLQQWPMYSYLPARDVSRARQFYEQRLGWQPAEEVAGGVAYAFADGTRCFLYPTPNAGTNRASQLFVQVEDVEREVADLKARGVTFEEYDSPGLKTINSIATGGGAKTAWFKDTEGNILAVVQEFGAPLTLAGKGRAMTARRDGARAIGALATGAFACGALAVGALAIGRAVIGSLAIGRARIRRLEIGQLTVGQLRVQQGQPVGF